MDTSRSVRRSQLISPLSSLLTSGCRCFAGGSTIVVLFEKSAAVEWDEDLLINSKACLETLVRVGMGLGRGKRKQVTDDTN